MAGAYGSRLTSSGLTGYTVPGALLVSSKSGNAMTLALKTAAGNDPTPAAPLYVGSRASAASGAQFEGRAITTAVSVTISSGSTLGVASGAPFRVWFVLIDDDGTWRIGAIVCSTSTQFVPLDENKLISATAEGGAGGADSAGVVYANAAVSSKPFRILGFATYESGLATAGTWNVDPDVVQMFGSGIKKPGEQVQSVINQSSALGSGTGTYPADDTVPTNTGGDQYFSTSFVGISAANWLDHDVLCYFAASATTPITMALFKDSVAAALASMIVANPSPYVYPTAFPMRARTQAPSGAATYKVRAGVASGSGATPLVINGRYAGGSPDRLLGGNMYSSHRITEVMA